MMQSSDNLHLAFLRRLAGEPLSVDRLRKGFELVALFFDLCGIEAELLGSSLGEGGRSAGRRAAQICVSSEQ